LSRSKHHQILISSRGELPEFATMFLGCSARLVPTKMFQHFSAYSIGWPRSDAAAAL